MSAGAQFEGQFTSDIDFSAMTLTIIKSDAVHFTRLGEEARLR